MTPSDNYWRDALARRLSRRRVVSLAGTATLALAGAACGGSTNNGNPAAASATSVSKSAAAGASPNAVAGSASSPAAGTPKRGGTLNIGYATRPGSLSPAVANYGDDSNFLYAIGDPLIAYKADGSPDPDNSLAQTFKLEDPTTLVLNLRTGVKFHDGTDFNAQAAKASLEYVRDPKNKSPQAASFKSVKSIETPDDHTLRLNLSQPDALIVANLGGRGAIAMSPAALDKLGDQFNNNPQLTGAYKVKEWIPGSHMTIERNPNYWRPGFGYIDSFVFQEITDDRVRLAALQSGNVSLARVTAGDMSAQAKTIKDIQLLKVTSGPALLAVNHGLAPLTDVRVRQTIMYAIDRSAELSSVWQGEGAEVHGAQVPPGNWGYADCTDIEYKFDVAKAKQMLKASGVPMPVQLKFICGSDPSDRSATAQLVKGFLEDVGFKINLDIIDRAQALSTANDPKSPYHLYSTGIPAPIDPGGTLVAYLTKDSYYNVGKSSTDPLQMQIDQLVAAGGSTYTQEDRKKAYVEAQRISIQNVMSVQPLVYNVAYAGVRANLKGTETLWMPVSTSWRLTGLWLA